MSATAQTDAPRALRARWVFPISAPPLLDAAVTIADGRIVAVGRPTDAPVEDLGNVALLPGLINAHTHLEFSDIATPIGNPDMGFVGWLQAVMEYRSTRAGNAASAIGQGIAESLRCGVTTIADIAQPGWSAGAYAAARCEGTLFLELIAPRLERVEKALQAAREHLTENKGVSTIYEENSADPFLFGQRGLSPHAPYTVHPELLVRVAVLSSECRAPLAMHLAESREELEFLADGAGPLRDLLESRGGYDPAVRRRGSRPLDELRCLLGAHRALLIHGNYLDDEEIEFLGRQRRRMAVVYCPRTHAWFDHAPYPLQKMLAAGAVVALGTDSRASSPDLSLLAEMRHVARTFPLLCRATILELGTRNGAQALGREAEIGALELGNWANLTAIRLPDDPRADPHEMLLDGEGEVIGTWVRGVRA